MEKLKNKNTIVLIISAVLILVAIVVAIVATASSNGDKKETTTKPSESVSIDLASIADKNNSTTKPKTQSSDKSYVYAPGKYKVATKDDPLGLRLEPNTASDRIIYVPKGHEVEVLAVWEDWGYVVYEKTGGWLSMNYLELVSGNTGKTEEPATTANGQ